MINKSLKYQLAPEVLSQGIDAETILLDMKSENYFGLNDVGSQVLEILKTGTDLETLMDGMLKIYDVERTILKKDIAELLQELLNAGLIQTVP
jgi:Coenzyme PQQ synthesis protein D (PqqD)